MRVLRERQALPCDPDLQSFRPRERRRWFVVWREMKVSSSNRIR